MQPNDSVFDKCHLLYTRTPVGKNVANNTHIRTVLQELTIKNTGTNSHEWKGY